MIVPARLAKTQVSIPSDTRPVQLQALYLKLRGRVLEVVARTGVARIVEKPFHRVHIDANVNRVWLEALCPRGRDEAVTLFVVDHDSNVVEWNSVGIDRSPFHHAPRFKSSHQRALLAPL